MKNCGIVVKKKAVNTVVIPYLKGIETEVVEVAGCSLTVFVIPYLKGIETHGRLTYTRR